MWTAKMRNVTVIDRKTEYGRWQKDCMWMVWMYDRPYVDGMDAWQTVDGMDVGS